ncbi:MAG TPA: SAM-dependent chlorinase/fluorinase [Polyangiaceae bacterium]|nr:SAM-dependent chlorinase/fluorinase [Polyangiaceae bacterium]
MTRHLPVPSGVITLLTDFGLDDPFVGVMTGVILSGFPSARIVHLCHGIRAQAVAEASFWLERCYAWFPPGSVHVVVVDPGVGSERRVLAAAINHQYFLVPDNGLLSPALLDQPDARVLAVDWKRLVVSPPSATFHGRDIFAPLAAALASGQRAWSELGAPATPLPSVVPAPEVSRGRARGEVVTIDRFGNLITNLDTACVERLNATHALIGERLIPRHRTYADVGSGDLLALVNSFGVLEIAQRDGSAERTLGAARGHAVELAAAAGMPVA